MVNGRGEAGLWVDMGELDLPEYFKRFPRRFERRVPPVMRLIQPPEDPKDAPPPMPPCAPFVKMALLKVIGLQTMRMAVGIDKVTHPPTCHTRTLKKHHHA